MKLYSSEETQERLGISRPTLYLWVRQGKLKPHISATYPLEHAADALNDVLNRKVKGKVVLLTGE